VTDLVPVEPYAVVEYVESGGFDNAVQAWLDAQISAHTVRSYAKAMELWRAYLDGLGIVLVDDTTADPRMYRGPRRHHADAWRSLLLSGRAPGLRTEATLAKKSVDSRLVAVRSFYDYLVDEEAIEVNPIRGVRLFNAGAEHPAQALDVDELKRLVDAAYATHAALPRSLVLLLATTGCRIAEALAVRVEDLGRSSGYPTVTLTRKGGKRQTLVIDAPVHEHLIRLVAGRPPEAFAFSRDDGQTAITYSAAWYLLDRAATFAGLLGPDRAHVHPHMLRATLITKLLNDGVPVEQVQEYVGHAKSETTLGYFRGWQQLAKQAEIAAKMGSAVQSSRGLEDQVA
jgi:integrase/recombinase XerD